MANDRTTTSSDDPGSRWAGFPAVVAYAAAALGVLVATVVLRPASDRGFVYTLGLHAGLVGFAVLILQVVLAARIRWIERPFGLDQIFRFHKAMGRVRRGAVAVPSAASGVGQRKRGPALGVVPAVEHLAGAAWPC